MATPGEFAERDEAQDRALRPKFLGEFTGQAQLVENLAVAIAAAKERGEPVDHVLLSGPPGVGKTTLAHIMAHEMGATIQETSGPMLDHRYDATSPAPLPCAN